MWLMDTRRMKHFAAMVLIGDGVMAIVRPKHDARAWEKGPKVWRDSMEWLAERPTLTRAIGAVQIVGGVLWALSESDD
jgi:drug/metabolite transporter (DMT)-like permease